MRPAGLYLAAAALENPPRNQKRAVLIDSLARELVSLIDSTQWRRHVAAMLS